MGNLMSIAALTVSKGAPGTFLHYKLANMDGIHEIARILNNARGTMYACTLQVTHKVELRLCVNMFYIHVLSL